MACFICGRNNCTPSFHSIEEQKAFEPAEIAYENYLAVLEKCRKEYEKEDDSESQ